MVYMWITSKFVNSLIKISVFMGQCKTKLLFKKGSKGSQFFLSRVLAGVNSGQ